MTAPDTRRPELATWLLERIAEDEAVARACVYLAHEGYKPHPELSQWFYREGGEVEYVQTPEMLAHPYPERMYVTCDGEGLTPAVDECAGEHIARHDPARVLAECAAKRRIVALHPPALWIQPESPLKDPRTGKPCTEAGEHWGGCEVCDGDNSGATYPCPTLRALAQPYAGAPGWREEWAT